MFIMTGLGIGVASLPASLPGWLLSIENGLSSAAVGIVALAAYKLVSSLAVNPLAIFICTASSVLAINLGRYPWCFPVLMVAGGLATILKHLIFASFQKKVQVNPLPDESPVESPVETEDLLSKFNISVRTGWIIIAVWIALVALCLWFKTLGDKALNLLGTMTFAGSLIFGGGPVVVPLLETYVVSAGWLTEQEFLIGLALNNALPGPNFNFAAFCGALTLRGSIGSSIGGAFISYVGIFLPGLLTITGVLPIWLKHRRHPMVQSVLSGVVAAAVGLVLSAVYQLSEKALVSVPAVTGATPFSIVESPYFTGVAVITFSTVGHLGVPAPVTILIGGVFGIFYWLGSGMP